MVTRSDELAREFVIASHGDLEKVKTMLAQHPDLLRITYDWGEQGGLEDGIGAAGHVGNRAIAEFFIAQGIEPNICVLAMLGRVEQVQALLKNDASLANARGAHGIGVLFHAAMGGSMDIMQALREAGCTEGYNFALHGAVNFRHVPVIKWLLDNGVTDQATKDFQGKTPLEKAQVWGNAEVIHLLEIFHPAS